MGKPSMNPVNAIINYLGEQAADMIADLRARSDMSEDERNAAILRVARDVEMPKGGRAAEYLDHFLGGTGTTKDFSTLQLMGEDPDVKLRLTSELTRRGLGIKTLREQTQKFTPIDRTITIFQKTYINDDWRLALGTFNFNWEVLGFSDDCSRIFVKAWGEDLYHWHPSDGRSTRFLHEAAEALVKAGKAKPFLMRAQPIVLALCAMNREVLQLYNLTQVNPSNFGAGHDVKSKLGSAAATVGLAAKEAVATGERKANKLLRQAEQAIEQYYKQ